MSRILIVHDVDGWAFHRWAQGIAAWANHDHVDFMGLGEFTRFTNHPPTLGQWDAICVMSWTESPTLVRERKWVNRYVSVLAHEGVRWDLMDRHKGWHAENSITPQRNRTVASQRLPTFDGLIATSPGLQLWATRNDLPCRYITAGVDTERFKPMAEHVKRRDAAEKDTHRKLRIGWCGQDSGTKPSIKGLREVLNPLRSALADRFEWDIHAASRTDDGYKGVDDMVRWYNGLDVFLCTSISEGGPATVFEAAACGVPVISTAVGDTAQVANCLIPTYTNAAEAQHTTRQFMTVLIELDGQRARLKTESLQARMRASSCCWRRLADSWCDAITGRK